MEWLESIHRIRTVKLALARTDPRGRTPPAPPAGASEIEIAGAERRLGFRLPPSYRALLAMHDGWPHLFAKAGLLGARALSRGGLIIEDRSAGMPPPGVDRGGGLVPFGIDRDAEVVFAWDTDAVRLNGEMEVVAWINDIGTRAASFPAMLELIVEMLSAELADRRGAAQPACPQDRALLSRRGLRSVPPQSHVRPRPVARIAAFG